MTWTLHAEGEFSSSHANGPEGHKCNNMHGHDWRAVVEVTFDTLDENGWGPDFGAIKAIIREMDHQNLNEILSFKPSAELIARHVYEEVWRLGRKPDFVEVWEGGANHVTYRG